MCANIKYGTFGHAVTKHDQDPQGGQAYRQQNQYVQGDRGVVVPHIDVIS